MLVRASRRRCPGPIPKSSREQTGIERPVQCGGLPGAAISRAQRFQQRLETRELEKFRADSGVAQAPESATIVAGAVAAAVARGRRWWWCETTPDIKSLGFCTAEA